jgi:hypothetical protein
MERKRRSLSFALLLVIALLALSTSSSSLSIQTTTNGSLSLNQAGHASFGVLSLKQPNSASSLELGYGPTSLSPISEKIPIYTTGDQLWIESNYASPVYVMLETSSTTLAQTSIQPNTIEPIYTFVSGLPSSNLTLYVPAYQLMIPIQFVNPTSGALISSTPHYSISNSTLVALFAESNQSDRFDIQQCLSNSSSATKALVPLPVPFGTGFIGITGDPSLTSAQILLNSANPAGPFSFSFELLANYTFTLPIGGSGVVGYGSSPVEVAHSDTVVLGLPKSTNGTNFGSAASSSSVINTTLTSLASLRSGRYLLIATFANGNNIQEVETPLLITSPDASTWFWLGSCVQLSDVSSLFSTQASLASSPSQWPRYLYLMYQIQPGVEAFTNVSLDLSLNAVRFTSSGNTTGLPSDIKLSWLSNPSIINSSIEGYGDAYFITNGSYPITTTFELSFAGRTFMTTNVVLQSPYNESVENIQLPQLTISVSQNGNAVNNATVTVHSNNLNASYVTHTSRDGRVVVFVPSGQYTITAQSGKYVSTPVEESFLGGSSYAVPINFPGPADYTLYLIWIVSIIAVIGAIGNLWFYLARRRIRQYLR